MERIRIEYPENIIFSTDIDIHGVYINRGNHVGNSAYVELCNETAQRFFIARQAAEYVVCGQALLNVGYVVQVKAEARYGDVLRGDLAVDGFHGKGCDFFYRFSQADSGELVALGRFSYLTFNFAEGNVEPAADSFVDFFSESEQ